MRIGGILFISAMLLIAIGCQAEAPKTQETNTGNAEATKPKEPAKQPASEAKDIVDTAAGLDDFKTLVTAVKAAELVDTLKGDGPFTVFAPTNDAFGKLPAGTVDGLLKPDSKDALKGILTYHVVAGKLDSKAVADAIKKGDGTAKLKTVQGEELSASLDGEKVLITDAKGGKSTVTKVDVMTSNGVIHVIDTVIMPSK